MNKRERLNKIYSGIKGVKIQGASNIARAALEAYSLEPSKKNKKKLESLRPTEPMLVNVLEKAGEWPKNKILKHFEEAQAKINKSVLKIINGKKIILTHCHSTNVARALIAAKKKGKKFEVYVTEARPLYQGRLTASELSRAGIKVTTFVDSGMHLAIQKADLILIGADALTNNGAINKIGSDAIAEIARVHKKPLYIAADSWKYSKRKIKIESRDSSEVWETKSKKIKIKNPAFEMVEKKYITGIISELGIMKYEDFLKKAK